MSNVSYLVAPYRTTEPVYLSPQIRLPAVVAVEVYRNDVRVVRASQSRKGGGKKEKIKEISMSSIKNAKHIIANSEPDLPSLMTFTYPETFPGDGRIVKTHFRAIEHRARRRFGKFSYFACVEYQKRGAPHLHVGASIDLEKLGEVVELTRMGDWDRKPKFQTHKPTQDWLFKAWLGVIGGSGEFGWKGLPDTDVEAMSNAYYYCNAGVSWEMMKKDNGAKLYLVKELSALKGYQKKVPKGFKNPGRHFLYSRDMKPVVVETFPVSDKLVRKMLREIGWKWLPGDDRPLYRDLWNVAAELAIKLVEAGIDPLKRGSLEELRSLSEKYAKSKVYIGGGL